MCPFLVEGGDDERVQGATVAETVEHVVRLLIGPGRMSRPGLS